MVAGDDEMVAPVSTSSLLLIFSHVDNAWGRMVKVQKNLQPTKYWDDMGKRDQYGIRRNISELSLFSWSWRQLNEEADAYTYIIKYISIK